MRFLLGHSTSPAQTLNVIHSNRQYWKTIYSLEIGKKSVHTFQCCSHPQILNRMCSFAWRQFLNRKHRKFLDYVCIPTKQALVFVWDLPDKYVAMVTDILLNMICCTTGKIETNVTPLGAPYSGMSCSHLVYSCTCIYSYADTDRWSIIATYGLVVEWHFVINRNSFSSASSVWQADNAINNFGLPIASRKFNLEHDWYFYAFAKVNLYKECSDIHQCFDVLLRKLLLIKPHTDRMSALFQWSFDRARCAGLYQRSHNRLSVASTTPDSVSLPSKAKDTQIGLVACSVILKKWNNWSQLQCYDLIKNFISRITSVLKYAFWITSFNKPYFTKDIFWKTEKFNTSYWRALNAEWAIINWNTLKWKHVQPVIFLLFRNRTDFSFLIGHFAFRLARTGSFTIFCYLASYSLHVKIEATFFP